MNRKMKIDIYTFKINIMFCNLIDYIFKLFNKPMKIY